MPTSWCKPPSQYATPVPGPVQPYPLVSTKPMPSSPGWRSMRVSWQSLDHHLVHRPSCLLIKYLAGKTLILYKNGDRDFFKHFSLFSMMMGSIGSHYNMTKVCSWYSTIREFLWICKFYKYIRLIERSQVSTEVIYYGLLIDKQSLSGLLQLTLVQTPQTKKKHYLWSTAYHMMCTFN